jgi:hypothetical protein
VRPQTSLRARRPWTVLGALAFAYTTTAGASLAVGSDPQGAQNALQPKARASISTTRRHLDVLVGHRVRVSGKLAPALPGREVVLDLRRGGRWQAVAHARTSATGAYRLSYAPRRSGSTLIQLRLPGDASTGPTRRVLGRVNSYRVVKASFYGPGMYGGGLACGGRLQPGRLGVANKTLPCGSRVTLRYRGRRVRVPVIDRGPYVAGREYDLTEATKRALGFPSTGALWATR